MRERASLTQKSNNLIGVMAVKIQFEKDQQMTPKRFICFGSLPIKNSQIYKVFEGPKCHLKFLLWALQNVAEYKIDNRKDNTKLNMFTFGGSQKEFPILLRGFSQLSGRDAHFFGDLNRIKCLWHENIKFFDLANFFDTGSVEKMSTEWRKSTTMRYTTPSDVIDPIKEKVIQIFELANRF